MMDDSRSGRFRLPSMLCALLGLGLGLLGLVTLSFSSLMGSDVSTLDFVIGCGLATWGAGLIAASWFFRRGNVRGAMFTIIAGLAVALAAFLIGAVIDAR